MIDDFKEIYSLILSFGFGATISFLFLLYILANPANILKLFATIIGFGHRLTGFFNRSMIKYQVEAHVNEGIQILSKEAPSAFIESMKLEWIKSGNECSNLDNDTVIVCVGQDNNLAKPIVDSTILYLKKGLLLESRPFIERKILSAIELVLAYRILINSPQKDAINYLSEKYIEPVIKDDTLSTYFDKAEKSNQAGILTRIILREYSGLSNKLLGKVPSSAIRRETVNFFDFASRFVNRENEIPLSFFGKYFCCTIALIARLDIVEKSGLDIYQRNFRRDIDRGVQIIYLLSRGPNNTKIGRRIAKWANEEKLIIGSIPDNFSLLDGKGGLLPAECIVCPSAKIGKDLQLTPIEEAQIALSSVIPETLTGDIDIISIVREPQKITKVLIHSDIHPNPIKFCKGDNDERLHMLIQEMGGSEIIDFIKYQPNIKDTVVAALTPLDSEDVELIQSSNYDRDIRVVVKSKAAAQRAVGNEGINLILAGKLLGVHIDLETQEDEISPEQYVIDILNYLVPEIKSKQIAIHKIARRRGRRTKIAVYSDSIPNLHKVFFSAGKNVSKDVSMDLDGENVNIILWDHSDMKKNIIESLYPLRHSEVNDIVFDSENNRATVYINNKKIMRVVIGRDGDNVKLAEIICDWKLDLVLQRN